MPFTRGYAVYMYGDLGVQSWVILTFFCFWRNNFLLRYLLHANCITRAATSLRHRSNPWEQHTINTIIHSVHVHIRGHHLLSCSSSSFFYFSKLFSFQIPEDMQRLKIVMNLWKSSIYMYYIHLHIHVPSPSQLYDQSCFSLLLDQTDSVFLFQC